MGIVVVQNIEQCQSNLHVLIWGKIDMQIETINFVIKSFKFKWLRF